MASKNTVRIAIGLLIVGGAYDVYYFANKSKKGPGPSVAAAEPKAAATDAEVALGDTVEVLRAQIAAVPALGPKAEHHPFLLQVEEQRGMPYEKIVKEREEKERLERERLERQKAKPKSKDKKAEDSPIDKFKLKAVLVQAKDAVALVNEYVMRVGEYLPGTQWVVDAIERDLVRLRRGKETSELRLDREP